MLPSVGQTSRGNSLKINLVAPNLRLGILVRFGNYRLVFEKIDNNRVL